MGTVLIVRHAEKASTPPGNPPLTAQGLERAQRLAQVCEKAGVTAVYATSFLRTQQTVQPLADQLAQTVLIENDIDTLVDKVRTQHRGEVVVIAGHSNTIDQVIDKLGGDTIPPVNPNEFDNLFVVTTTKCSCGNWEQRRIVTLKLQYGEPSP
ncbi:MAG: SixA phosphatase family protein [Planctomycetota bacterium]